MPVRVLGVEGTADVHGVDAEPVEELVRGLRKLLHDVVDARALIPEAEVLHQPGMGDSRDAGARVRAQVDGQPVRLAVLDGCQHPIAG